jgi:hypothetical protein
MNAIPQAETNPDVNALWRNAVVSANDIIGLIWSARDNLRQAAFDSSIPQFVREDALQRVADLDEAERQINDGLLCLKHQLVHVSPANPEKSASDPVERISPSVLVN